MTQQAWIQVMMSAAGSLGFSVLYNVRGKKLLLEALGGGVSWLLFLLLARAVPSEPWRYFICAAFVATYAEVLARLMKTPATTFLIPAMIPLIPGGALYQTMRLAVEKDWSACLGQAFYTFMLALALAMGIVAVLSVFDISGLIQSHLRKEELPL